MWTDLIYLCKYNDDCMPMCVPCVTIPHVTITHVESHVAIPRVEHGYSTRGTTRDVYITRSKKTWSTQTRSRISGGATCGKMKL